jgi:preprotein translocase subunit YajC
LKKQKEHKALVAALKTGDEVVTSGGIFGVVTQVKADRLVVEIAKNTRVEMEKTAVTAVLPPEKDEKASAPAGKGDQA